MAFHRIGNSIYSDDEIRGRSEETMSIVIPAIVTAVAVYYLHGYLSGVSYFVVHTTTAKLIYVLLGLTVFCVSHIYHRVIAVVVVLAIGGTLMTLSGMALWHWLKA